MRKMLRLLIPALIALNALSGVGSAQITEDLKLNASDGSGGDYFGWSVAVSGNTAVIGADSDDDNGSDSGSAYVFNVTTGQELFKLTASDAAPNDLFGVSVAVSGNMAVIGAQGDDDEGTNSGSAYVFDVSSGQELFKLTASDGTTAYFGTSVAVSGNTAVIGSPFDNGSSSGSAYVFDVTTGQKLFKLTASDKAAGDDFGKSVAVSGTTAVIGSRNDDDNGSDSGSAYVFDVTTGQELFKLIASDGAENDRFGWSVAVSGNTAVIGALSDNDNGPSSGSAYVFDVTTGQELFKLTASDGAGGDVFGVSVAVSGNTAVIGARGDDDNGLTSGSAYSFDVTTGQELSKLTACDGASGDRFGDAVAVSGNTAVIGAWEDDDNGTSSGSAYVFDLTADGFIRYCGASQNPNNAAVIDIDTIDSSAASISVSLSCGPANQFIYLLVGNGNGTVSQPPGAKGDLCIVGGSCLGRYDKDVGQVTSAGTFSTDIRNTISNPCAGAVTITPGATWNFQYWHRQPMGQPATFSDAISVTFQ